MADIQTAGNTEWSLLKAIWQTGFIGPFTEIQRTTIPTPIPVVRKERLYVYDAPGTDQAEDTPTTASMDALTLPLVDQSSTDEEICSVRKPFFSGSPMPRVGRSTDGPRFSSYTTSLANDSPTDIGDVAYTRRRSEPSSRTSVEDHFIPRSPESNSCRSEKCPASCPKGSHEESATNKF